MLYSSYFVSALDVARRPFSEPFLVVGYEEAALAPQLIAAAVARGVRTIVMERGKAGVYQRPCQGALLEGVSYFFVRSLPETLNRWKATCLGPSTAL